MVAARIQCVRGFAASDGAPWPCHNFEYRAARTEGVGSKRNMGAVIVEAMPGCWKQGDAETMVLRPRDETARTQVAVGSSRRTRYLPALAFV